MSGYCSQCGETGGCDCSLAAMTSISREERVDLLPCPFCESVNSELYEDGDPKYPWAVRTEHYHECFLAYSNTNRHRSYASQAEAIASWNTRALTTDTTGD